MVQGDEYRARYVLTKRSLFDWNHHMHWKQFPVIGFSPRPFLVTFQPMQAKVEQRTQTDYETRVSFFGAFLAFRHIIKNVSSATLAPPLHSFFFFFNKTLNLAQAPIIGMPFSSNKVSRARQSCFATPERMCADGPLCIGHNSWCHLCAGALKKEIYSLRGFIVTANWPFYISASRVCDRSEVRRWNINTKGNFWKVLTDNPVRCVSKTEATEEGF